MPAKRTSKKALKTPKLKPNASPALAHHNLRDWLRYMRDFSPHRDTGSTRVTLDLTLIDPSIRFKSNDNHIVRITLRADGTWDFVVEK